MRATAKPASDVPQWYVARTRFFRHEIKMRDWLSAHEIEVFVPTEKVHSRRVAGGARQRKMVEKPLAPNLVFLYAGKEEACSLVADYKLPMEFIVDCATHKMMVVSEKEMDDFKRVLDNSIEEGGMMDKVLEFGDRVRVIKGPLKGVEGCVAELRGKHYVAVSLAGLAWASAQVPRAWMIKI